MTEASNLLPSGTGLDGCLPEGFYHDEIKMSPDSLGRAAFRLFVKGQYGEDYWTDFDSLAGPHCETFSRVLADAFIGRLEQQRSGWEYTTLGVFAPKVENDGSDEDPASRLAAVADFFTVGDQGEDTQAMLSMLYVDPEYGRQGMQEAALLGLVESHARELGASVLRHAGPPDRDTTERFKGLGFSVVGAVKELGEVTRIVMDKDLVGSPDLRIV